MTEMVPVQAEGIVGRRKVFEDQAGDWIAFRDRHGIVKRILVADANAGDAKPPGNARRDGFKIDQRDVKRHRCPVCADIAVELLYGQAFCGFEIEHFSAFTFKRHAFENRVGFENIHVPELLRITAAQNDLHAMACFFQGCYDFT